MHVRREVCATRRHWRERATSAAIGAAFSMVASRAVAQPNPPVAPVRLEYHAPDACPDERAFVARVRSRTTRFVLAGADATGGDEVARSFSVDVSTTPHGVEGRLTSLEATRTPAPATRVVAGETCDEVVDALALITALAVDPNASTAFAPAPVPEPPALDRPPGGSRHRPRGTRAGGVRARDSGRP